MPKNIKSSNYVANAGVVETDEDVNDATDGACEGRADISRKPEDEMRILQEDQIFLQNICFGQLGFGQIA